MAIPTRVGILVPSTNTAAEADFRRAMPPAITVHSHRLWLETANSHSEGAMDGMNSQLEDGARHLAAGKMNVVAMVGTTNSFYKGKTWSDEMEEIMSRGAGGLPAVASSPSIAQALRHYGVKKLSVATPYPDWNNGRLKEYFEEAGFDVLNVDGEPWAAAAGAQGINDQDPEDIVEFGTNVCDPDADALFCSCSAWRAMEAADELENNLGKPVITTNQATFWRVMQKLEVNDPVSGGGRLLEEMPPIEDR